MVKLFLAALAVPMLSGLAIADANRERKARVALALAAAERAPDPLPDYAEGYRLALKGGQPLVVYVGCGGGHPIERIPNVVVCTAKELTGYGRGTVVVGYPRGGSLYVHTTLRCPDHGATVARIAEEARKKIAAPCVCGSGCACSSGTCPQKCPVMPQP